jgi:hypothetical protein
MTPVIEWLYPNIYGTINLGDPTPNTLKICASLRSSTSSKLGILINKIAASDIGATLHTAASLTGGNFNTTNQPNNDGVNIVSNDVRDVGAAVTVYFTNYNVDFCYKEVVLLTGSGGTDAFNNTVSATIGKVLGIEKPVTYGTVTVSELSGAQTIITLAPTATAAGVIDIPTAKQMLYGMPFGAIADGTTTQKVGVVGANQFGTEIYGAIALNSSTGAVYSQLGFHRATKLLYGAVESARTVVFSIGRLTWGASSIALLDTNVNEDINAILPVDAKYIHWVLVGATETEGAASVKDRLIIRPRL